MVRVGVIGGGQLAWMMVPSAQKLGINLHIQTPNLTDPAAVALGFLSADDGLFQTVLPAPIDDAGATETLSQRCDVITFENEFVDLDALEELAYRGIQFYPQIQSLKPLLDKYHQRQCFQQLQIPIPQFAVVDDGAIHPDCCLASLRSIQSLGITGFPLVLKARRHGYDGKGTHIVTTEADWCRILASQSSDISWLVEEFVPFDRELAVIAARSRTGEIAVYPVVETQQDQQVCRRVLTLLDLSESVQHQVETIASTLLTHLDFVGVLAIEFFLTQDDQVLVNEVAPRTHNSGHYTIDACVTSQFEQQLRAVTGLPLGSTHLTCRAAVMVNLLGYEQSEDTYEAKRSQLATLPHTQVYWYGKSICQPGRKMGHVTTVIPNALVGWNQPDVARAKLEAIATTIEQIWYPANALNG